MQNNKLNKEEQAFRDKLNEAIFSYDSADWQAVKSKMNKGGAKAVNNGVLIKAAAALLIAVGVVLALQYNYKNDTVIKEQEHTSELDEIKTNQPLKEEKQTTSLVIEAENTIESEEVEQLSTVKETKATLSNKKEEKEAAEIVKEEKSVEVEKSIPIEEKVAKSKKITPFTAFIRINGERCLGNVVVLKADCDVERRSLQYIWKVNNENIESQAQKIELTLNSEGDYNIELQIRDQDGNVLSEIENTFEVGRVEPIDFTYLDQRGILNDFEVVFEYKNNQEETQWFVNNKEIALTESNTYDFKATGIYDVKLVQTNASGCASTIEKPVVVQEDFIPLVNAFTPNGDGVNDEFIPKGFEDFDGYFRFIVYEQNGAVVYETNQPTKAWNGKRNNTGSLMPEGSYVWKIEVKKGDKQRVFSDRVRLLNIK